MRTKSSFENVAKMPWPVGAGLAIIILILFHVFKHFYPLHSLNPAVSSMLPVIAHGFSGLLLFAALVSFVAQIIRSRRFKATKSLEDVRNLSWRQFEALTGEIFRRQGYFVIETPEGPDNGVDLVLRKDGVKTYVQCKHWKSNSVGVEKVRELLGAMAVGGASSGIFVASGNYTEAAEKFARKGGIQLIGGNELRSLLDQAQINEPQRKPQDSQVGAVECPICQSPMLKKTAKRGSRRGNVFWGCSRFPECRGTRDF